MTVPPLGTGWLSELNEISLQDAERLERLRKEQERKRKQAERRAGKKAF